MFRDCLASEFTSGVWISFSLSLVGPASPVLCPGSSGTSSNYSVVLQVEPCFVFSFNKVVLATV